MNSYCVRRNCNIKKNKSGYTNVILSKINLSFKNN